MLTGEQMGESIGFPLMHYQFPNVTSEADYKSSDGVFI